MTYDKFIQNILDTRGRFGVPAGEYKERHHIIPKCLGGTNDESNLIDLYAREHFEAHMLLAEENKTNKKLWYAVWTMARLTTVQGNNRYKPTAEQYEIARKKFSEYRKGENNPMYGKSLSDEHRKNLSESHKNSDAARKALEKMWAKNIGREPPNKGHKASDETRRKLIAHHQSDSFKNAVQKKIFQYAKDGTFIREYQSINEAADNVNASPQSISRVLRKIRKSCKGYVWVYANGNDEFSYNPIEQNKRVQQFSKDGKLIAEYHSIAEAGRAIGKIWANGVSPNISKCCRGKQKTAYGYIWKYATDVDDEQEE